MTSSREAEPASATEVARTLVALYPPAWRRRYADEMLALLADTGVGLAGAVNLVGSAAVAWLRPSRTLHDVAARRRTTLCVVLCGWTLLAAGTMVFGQFTEDASTSAKGVVGPPAGGYYLTYLLAVHLSSLVVLAVGALVAARVWRLPERRRSSRLLLLSPIAALVGFTIGLLVIVWVAPRSSTPGVGIGTAWFAVLTALGVLAGAGCAAGPAMAVHRSALDGRSMRIAVIAAAAATATMAGAILGSLGYLVAAQAGAFTADSAAWLAGYGLPMVLVLIACVVSSWRGLLTLRPVA